eukprot:5012654-Pleurochrysis_carterae.AAC.1
MERTLLRLKAALQNLCERPMHCPAMSVHACIILTTCQGYVQCARDSATPAKASRSRQPAHQDAR